MGVRRGPKLCVCSPGPKAMAGPRDNSALFATIKYVLKYPRAFAVVLMLVIVVGITLAATVSAEHHGMCGDGDFRPSCVMFAFGLHIYGMIGLLAVTTLATVVTYVVRRRPPVLLKVASILSGTAVAALVLPVWFPGNKLGGSIVVMMLAPFLLILLGGASCCVLLWLCNVTGGWIERRAAVPAGLSHNRSFAPLGRGQSRLKP